MHHLGCIKGLQTVGLINCLLPGNAFRHMSKYQQYILGFPSSCDYYWEGTPPQEVSMVVPKSLDKDLTCGGWTYHWVVPLNFAWNCWWFRNPAFHLGCIKTLINYLATGAGFLPLKVSLLLYPPGLPVRCGRRKPAGRCPYSRRLNFQKSINFENCTKVNSLGMLRIPQIWPTSKLKMRVSFWKDFSLPGVHFQVLC